MSNEQEEASSLTEVTANRVVRLKNNNCAYCSVAFAESLKPTKEHVIGRNFVPKGTLDGVVNLHLNVCANCNNDKSNLEDDISVITMHPDAQGRYAVDDPRVRAEVARKAAKSRSRRTGKAIAAGEQPMLVKGSFGPAEITFSMVMPPQVDHERLYRLARYQLTAFLYHQTYNETERRGRFWNGGFFPIIYSSRNDWGNPLFKWFQDVTNSWPDVYLLNTADGFFRVWIKYLKPSAGAWAWAIEWNKNFRLIGFFGQEVSLKPFLDRKPELAWKTISDGPVRRRMRIETPIDDAANDTLFKVFDDP
jgi:hypothetical protein